MRGLQQQLLADGDPGQEAAIELGIGQQGKQGGREAEGEPGVLAPVSGGGPGTRGAPPGSTSSGRPCAAGAGPAVRVVVDAVRDWPVAVSVMVAGDSRAADRSAE